MSYKIAVVNEHFNFISTERLTWIFFQTYLLFLFPGRLPVNTDGDTFMCFAVSFAARG